MTQRKRRVRFTSLCDDDRYFLALLELKCAIAIVELAAIHKRNIHAIEDRISSTAIDAMQQISIEGIEATIKDLNQASDLYRKCALKNSGLSPMDEHRKRFEVA
jgi:hypothetical protein